MSLRRQLLLLALLLLLLPVAGWFTAREIQAALRDAEERASLAGAASLARALLPVLPEAPGGAVPLRVHAAPGPRVVDGFDDDWAPWLPWRQRFSARAMPLSFDLHLASHARRLYGLMVVRDRTASSAASTGDEVRLAFGDGWRVRLGPALPGRAAVARLAGPAGDLPLRAAWRALPGEGYRVEFSLPLSLTAGRLAVSVLDPGEGRPGAPPAVAAAGSLAQPRRLRLPDGALAERLAQLAGEERRLWVVDPERWVLGVAGGVPAVSVALRGWRRTVYDWVSTAPPVAVGAWRDPAFDLRLSGPELDAALAGRPAVRLQAPVGGGAGVRASTAVPLERAGERLGALVVEAPGEGLLVSTSRAFFGTVVLSTLLALAVALALLGYAGWLSLRIRRLRDAAEAVAAGEAAAVPAQAAADEIGDLSRSFARLLGQLGEYNRYLQGLAGRLAHELDTPLTIVRSSLEHLRAEALPPAASPYLERAGEGAERLAAIFRAMREARRLEEAVGRAELEPLDPAALLAGCCDAYRGLDAGHRWSLEVGGEGEVEVAGAGELLAQALDKLVDNARGFAPPGAEIRLFCRPRGRGVLLGVANDGPLLPGGAGARLFDSMVSVREDGDGFHLGLGLHIVRLVARAHGGKVLARNREDGSGVEFGLWLPLLRPARRGRTRLESRGPGAYNPRLLRSTRRHGS